MKLVFRTFIFHIICIIVFAIIYLYISDQFIPLNNNVHQDSLRSRFKYILDFFILSTSIQTSIGLTNLYPTSSLSKILIIIQELIMVSSHLVTLYVFTL